METSLKPVFHDPEKVGDPRVALKALIAHRSVLAAPGLVFGVATPARSVGEGMIEMGYFTLGPEAVAFIGDVYAYGWVRDFDWMTWSRTAQGGRLLQDPVALANADEDDFARVLTVCMREAHWGPEALNDRFREGLLTRVLERAAALFHQRY